MLAGLLLDAPLFADRTAAGRELLGVLPLELDAAPAIVGLAHGGVVVAAEIADGLRAPLDALAVRKIRHPAQPEYALGAVAPGGCLYLGTHDGLTPAAVSEARREAEELDRLLHASRPPVDCAARTVLLVDDGLATGATMIAAARWARSRGASRTVAAFPVAARQSIATVLDEVDLIFCPHVRTDLGAVGVWYANFDAVSDADVLALLATR